MKTLFERYKEALTRAGIYRDTEEYRILCELIDEKIAESNLEIIGMVTKTVKMALP